MATRLSFLILKTIIMIELKKTFRRQGQLFTQLKRNDVVALYSVGGHYSDRTSYYDVCKISIRKPDKRCNEFREALPTDSQWGNDKSRHFNNLNAALKHFDELTERLKLSQLVSKSVKGVEEYIKVIP